MESILSQSLEEIEVICVDDGSKDTSGQILQEFAASDSRVKLLTEENHQAGTARNKGFEAASGEYVHFMEADDYVLDYAYASVYHKAVKYDLDCIKFCGITYNEKEQHAEENAEYSMSDFGPGDFQRLLTFSEGSPVYKLSSAPWTALYRRSFLLEHEIRFNDLFCVNDRSFSAHVISAKPRIMACRDRAVVHRIHRAGSLTNKRPEHFDCLEESIRIIERQLKKDHVETEIARKIINNELEDLGYWCKKLAQDKAYGEDILREAKRFLGEELPYPLAYDLLLELEKSVESPQKEAAPKSIDVFFEECTSPKVSVVLPIYNQEEYLNHALYTLTMQTLHEMEFICVNDGSTDDSMTIIREYASIDKRFKIIDKENSGYGHSMNVGIDAAKGKYLGILEPDDYVPFDMYEKLYAIASKDDLEIVKADFYRFGILDNGELQEKRVSLSQDKTRYNRTIDPSEETEVFRFVMNTWSGIYKLDFLNKWHIRHHESPGASFQDLGFWFQTFCRAKKLRFCDKPFYRYRRDNPNASMYSKGKFSAHQEEYKFIWDFLSKDPEMLQKYENIFYYKKFNSYSMTYYRLDPEFKRDYLHLIYDEFKEPMEQGKLKEELFEPRLWTMLNEILEDPDAYEDKIRVSVIIPAYNAEPYLRECLDPILQKSEIRFEVICVDDGSTDNTLEILKEYAGKDSRVRYIHQENAGAGAARNTGMKYAKGQYLAFLDADDIYDPEMLRRVYEKANAENSDVIVFRCDQYFMADNTFKSSKFTIKNSLLPEERPFAGSAIRRDVFRAFVGWPWDKMFRADFVRENDLKFQEQRTTNDMLFVFSALLKAERISLLEMVLAHHRRAAAGSSLSVSREQSWRCFYDALTALRDQLKTWGLYERYERDFIDYALHFSLWNLHTIKGPSYSLLYNKLKDEWFDELGITGMDPLYFSDPEEYDTLQLILSSDADEYMSTRIDLLSGSMSEQKSMLSKNQKEIEKLKAERSELWDVKRERGLEIQALRREISKQKQLIDAADRSVMYNAEKEAKKIIKKSLHIAKDTLKKVRK